MGMADKVTKDYVSDTDVFADAFNYLIYDGRQVVKAEELSSVDPSSLLNIFWSEDQQKKKEIIQRYRDVLKRAAIHRDGRVTYVLFGIEGQTAVHYAMPVRDMLYDGLQYAEQVSQFKAWHRARKDDETSDEFLSGMHADDKLTPVVTLVIYFGTKPWDAPRRLSDMMTETDPKIARFIQDYELTIIEPFSMEDNDFTKFSTDLGEVLKFLKYAEDREQINILLTTDKSFHTMKRKAAQVLNICTGLNVEVKEDEEVIDVCKAWEDQKRVGEQEGRQEGIKQHKRDSILRMLKNGRDLKMICEDLDVSPEEVEKIQKELLALA